MSEPKIIRRVDYGLAQNPLLRYERQAREFLLGNLDGKDVYTPLSITLARTYIPNLAAAIPENPHRYPPDVYLYYHRNFRKVAWGIQRQLSRILDVTGGIIQDQRVLDLGCGSTGGTEDFAVFGYLFHPWLCRTLLELGVKPIGVDMGNLNRERFEAVQADLLQAGALDFIPDDSVDVVHTRALFSSPSLQEQQEQEVGQLARVLEPQIIRVLKPGGAFVYSKNF